MIRALLLLGILSLFYYFSDLTFADGQTCVGFNNAKGRLIKLIDTGELEHPNPLEPD